MKKSLLALTLLAPVVCQAQMITFAGDAGFTYFDHDHTPISKPGNHFMLTVDDTNPLEIFGLSLEIDGIGYNLDKSMGVRYSHELPSYVGEGMPVLNASGYFNNTDGETGFEWSLHLEFANNEPYTSYKITDNSLENFFTFETPDEGYFNNPFFREVIVPEPSSLTLIGLGLLGVLYPSRKSTLRRG
ncbi:PEP-CTERM sorting domain-containing protein [Alkalimarinus alittae]|uniref:PEP-CTERM sorting domain-containing protein n=1 Tax=Alkalimarinus alittae TaxID=2961619 RepID=A0ABY6MX56_9ALTE|nr:PEP-CTERM sorting domain-containing protein [Alkalimarinus alittae]UZE94369.1 PEP-CTERM sorting domain-containing protein [Alkalimarinus alittae]